MRNSLKVAVAIFIATVYPSNIYAAVLYKLHSQVNYYDADISFVLPNYIANIVESYNGKFIEPLNLRTCDIKSPGAVCNGVSLLNDYYLYGPNAPIFDGIFVSTGLGYPNGYYNFVHTAFDGPGTFKAVDSYTAVLTAEIIPSISVPELDIWAMMIAGFAAIGTIMRKRRNSGSGRPSELRQSKLISVIGKRFLLQ